MQGFRNLVLICAFVAAAAMTLVQFLHRGATPLISPGSTETQTDRGGRKPKRWIFRTIAFLVVAALGGFLFSASGIMPIKASSGHWPITAWLLNFTMRRSVITHSLGMNAPKLDDAALVAKGATHYEFGCRPCHGGPHLPQPVIAGHMTPHPPHLPPEIPKWESEELFYIVKHGVKFTGMPAWPAQQRDDEVWAVVAFLLKMPKLTAQEYQKVARSLKTPAATIDDLSESKQAPRIISENCARCHIVDHRARDLSVFPILAGQRPDYLFASLLAFARGERHSGIMRPLAASLTAKDMREIAQYYGNLPAPPAAPISEEIAPAIERGKEIAMRGIPTRRVPACSACHGPNRVRRNPIYPELAGQHSEYLALQLQLFHKQSRGGTPYAHIMHRVAGRLTRHQMRDVTSYYGSLHPAAER
ncbi:MAG TPA: c-type cytochrome [Candidatus Polarisedimenticolaceae bacterium]|nr:c-type cytochrome [Candidatus Polarisedimenticolaceae bacterium]